jgi:hypothetical protein
MPSQLYNNEHIWFMCARNFTWNGKDYKLGEKFDQDVAPGRIDLLVRTRRVVAVVKDTAHKPRHWHHHVWLEKDAKKKLGLLKSDSDALEGESLYNKPRQFHPKDASDSTTPEVRDESDEIRQAMMDNIEKEKEVDKEREENLDKERVTMKDGEPVTIDGIEQTEPLDRVEPDQGRDISDLHDDVQTGGDYSPHDGDVDDANLTDKKDDDDDAAGDSTVRDKENSYNSRAAKKTAAKKTAAKKQS